MALVSACKAADIRLNILGTASQCQPGKMDYIVLLVLYFVRMEVLCPVFHRFNCISLWTTLQVESRN